MKAEKLRTRPGLAKAGAFRLVARRKMEVLRSADYRWRELFQAADVMSEGAIKDELEGACYYGTTSVLLPFVSRGGLVPDDLAMDVARMVARDPHARVRAVRIACREAQVRSVHTIGRVHADVVVRPDSRGIRIDIDVQASVVAGRGRLAR